MNRKGAAVLSLLVFGLSAACTPNSGSLRAFKTGEAGVESAASTGPVLVRCGEGQRALVRRFMSQGEMAAEVQCVDSAAPSDTERLVVPTVQRQVVTRVAEPRTVRQAVYRAPARKKRSGRDSAAIIVGSAAAGAGIGGLIKGKKGALFGALLGGGAGAIYDRTTRHK